MEVYADVERGGRGSAEVGVLRVLVLGPLVIEGGGRTVHVAGTHRRRLLALLASRVGEVVGVDVIVDALWGDAPPSTAAKTVQSHVARLRASLAAVGRELIETTPGGYRLAASGVEVDAARFERRADEGHRRLAIGDFTGAIAVLSDALAEWRGVPYTDFPEVAFADRERTRLEDIHARAVEDHAEARLQSGAATAVTSELERLVGEHPGRERSWGLLMRALYAGGRQQEALVAFQRARRVLAESFGLEPGPELRAVERRVLEQDPELTIVQRSDVPAALRAASDDFVGRAAERAWLIEAWETARRGSGDVRVLLGAPDSGRTRLVAQVAAVAAGDHAAVLYAQGADDVVSQWCADRDPRSPSTVLDAVAERSRSQPVLLVVDDVEWSSAATMELLAVLAIGVEQLPVLLVVVADPAGGGPAIEALARLDASGGGRSHMLAPLPDDDIARLIAADGIDDAAAAAAIVAVAAGRPGVARREAVAWAEQVAGDRLYRAAATSTGMLAAADAARGSVVDEVAGLVRARARRQRLTSAAWLGRQPYRGLLAYGPADVDVFVGRERLVAELATRVLDRRLVVVTGASGSGKSSLVRAGLIPLVQSGRLHGGSPWRVSLVVPGDRPLGVLDGLVDLDEPGAQLLVVDQFEEVFVAEPTVVDAFVGRLIDLALDPALDAHIVLVVRADQYGNLAGTRHLADLVTDASLLVGRPSDDELRRIVEEPAVRAGCRVEPALIAAVLDDVGHSDGTLPLMSTALAELWEQRDGIVLTLERYRAMGGLAASVERLGTLVLDGDHTGAGVDAVRRAMLLLADVTDVGSWVRQRVHRDEVPSELGPALDALVAARLVVSDGETVEIAHEVVFRAWPQLHAWLDDARADLVLGRDLRLAARAWDDQGRCDDDVYRGARLAAGVEWCQRHPESTTPQMAEFVAAGAAVADRDRLEAEAQLARERRAARRLRRALVAASVLLVLSLVAAGLALVARRRADSERDAAAAARLDAENQRDSALVSRLVAESESASTLGLDLALLLAVEARRLDDSNNTRGSLLAALGSAVPREPPSGSFDEPMASSLVGFIATGLGRAVDVDLSGDGRIVAVSGAGRTTEGAVAIHDVRSGAELRLIELHEVPHVDLSEDGRRALVWGGDHAEIYDIGGLAPVSMAQRAPGSPAIEGASVSPDDDTVAVAWGDGTTTFHDAGTGDRRDVPAPDGAEGFAPDGSFVATLNEGFGVLLWDVASGQPIRTVALDDQQGSPGEYTLSPDLEVLVGTDAVDEANRVFVWDMATGRPLGDPDARPLARSRAVFVTERIFAFVDGDGAIVFYDLVSEQVVRASTTVHAGGTTDIAASRAGGTLVSVGDNEVIGVWGPDDRSLIDRPIVEDRWLGAVTADGDRAAVVTPDGRVEIVSLDGSSSRVPIGRPVESGFEVPVKSVTFSGDGSHVLVLNHDGRAFLADTRTGEPIWFNATATGQENWVENGDIASDGSRVFLELDIGRELRSVDVPSGDIVAQVFAADLGLGDQAFWTAKLSPDGRFLDAVLGSGVARFDAATLELIDHVDVGIPPRTEQNPFRHGLGDLVHVPESNEVIAVGRLGRIYRIDMASGEVVTTGSSRDHDTLWQVSVSTDGSVVAATSASGLSLLDADTLEPIGDPLRAVPRLSETWFTADGDLVSNSRFGVSEWELEPEEWQAIACQAAGRNLTRAEWDEYLGDEPYRATCPQWPPASD